MNDLIILNNNTLTMSSREIAELTGKEHRNVTRDIYSMLSGLQKDALNFEHTYFDSMNRAQTELRLPKRETLILVSGYSIALRAKIIDRWQELEAQQHPQFTIPKTLSEALRLAADQAEVVEAQQLLIEQQKPAVQFLEQFVETKSTKGLREVAKVLGIKEREFIAALEAKKILFRQSGQLLPFAQFQHDGYFEVKTGEANGHAFHQTRFTPKGISWITKKLGLVE